MSRSLSRRTTSIRCSNRLTAPEAARTETGIAFVPGRTVTQAR